MTPVPMISHADASIGIFDSGLGGLTVAREIVRCLPGEHLIFVADQAHVPYGDRDLAEVRDFGVKISTKLLESRCKAVVMACNISSAVALETVRTRHNSIPILGTIHAGSKAAAAATRNGRIGVLATTGTVMSNAYQHALHLIDANLQVTQVACPKFVPLVEAGQERSVAAQQAVDEYLAPLLIAEVDTVILGCTHYGFLRPMLEVAAKNLCFIDPAHNTALALQSLLARQELHSSNQHEPTHLLYTTGKISAFASQLSCFLPDTLRYEVRQAKWEQEVLHLESVPFLRCHCD